MKQYAALFLLVLLSFGSITAIPTSVYASSSSDEEEEEESEEEATTSQDDTALPPPTTAATPAPPAPATQSAIQQQQQQQQQQQTQAQPPNVSSTFQNGAPTTAELIEKYGANRTLPSSIADSTLNGTKAVVLTFDDNWKSQYTYAEPILRNNHFNATFFLYCLGLDQGPAFMTAEEARDLQKRNYDIQSHSMTHIDLTGVSNDTLAFEIGQSKPCLEELIPGANITGFATPFATGNDNATIIQTIADSGFDYGRLGYGQSFDLACAGYYVPENQTAGCEMFDPGTNNLKMQSKWNIPVADANGINRANDYDLNRTQTAFIRELEEGVTVDGEGNIKTIPILVYHNFTNRLLPPEEMGQSLLAESFAQQMAFLRANNYRVLSLADLVYDPASESFTIPKIGSQ